MSKAAKIRDQVKTAQSKARDAAALRRAAKNANFGVHTEHRKAARVVVPVIGDFHTHRVGGSARRGHNASNLFGAARLRALVASEQVVMQPAGVRTGTPRRTNRYNGVDSYAGRKLRVLEAIQHVGLAPR